MSVLQYYSYSCKNDYAIDYNDFGIVIVSSFLFMLIKYYASNCPPNNIFISYTSKISFAVYFVHICVMVGSQNTIDYVFKVLYFQRFIILLYFYFLLNDICIF